MKLYKFRSLGNIKDFKRIKMIIDETEKGKFWCSYFWELNDPMEGLFFANKYFVKKLFEEKKRHMICSLSGKNGFRNPLLWGHYANGFKGIAIEIEVNIRDIYQIQYVPEIFPTTIEESNINDKHIQDILTRKLIGWQHEDEFRILVKVDKKNKEDIEDKEKEKEKHRHDIGKITSVYFGDPYGNIDYSHELKQEEAIKNYNENKDKLKKYLDKKTFGYTIGYKDVKIYNKNNGTYVGVKNEEW